PALVAVSARASDLRPASTTLKPWPKSARAAARPIPDPAPVTITDLWEGLIATWSSEIDRRQLFRAPGVLSGRRPRLRRGGLWLRFSFNCRATCCFAHRDIFLGRHPFDRFADHVQGKVVNVLEPNARLAHIELLACLGPRLLKPLCMVRFAVDAHQIDR